MWPFKKQRSESIVEALRRIGLRPTAKIYRRKGGRRKPPDDGQIYGQHTVTVDKIIIRFYTKDGRLEGIKAISEAEYFGPTLPAKSQEEVTRKVIEAATETSPTIGQGNPDYKLMPYHQDEHVVEFRELELPLCTPEKHPECSHVYGPGISPPRANIKRRCLDCGAPVEHPDHDHCGDCVREP